MRAAVIGIGSNSLRLLVADRKDEQLTAILRQREGLRVFASLSQQSKISSDMIRQTCGSVERMRLTAQKAGAKIIRLFATSAVRDAINQQELSDMLLQKTGLLLDICSGEMEARLSFIGATEGLRSGLIDIGGGSTEIVIGEREAIEFTCSVQAGAVRLFREIPIDSIQDVHRVKEIVKNMIAVYQQKFKQIKTPTVWVGVGGTMTAAATYIQDIDWRIREGIHGFTTDVFSVKHMTETLAELTLEQRQTLRSIPPDRADIIVHGFSILLGCMEALQILQIAISEHTNLDGYLKLMAADE